MKPKGDYKRPPIQQHKDLLTDLRYRQRIEVGKKVRLYSIEEKDFELQLKEYLENEYHSTDP